LFILSGPSSRDQVADAKEDHEQDRKDQTNLGRGHRRESVGLKQMTELTPILMEKQNEEKEGDGLVLNHLAVLTRCARRQHVLQAAPCLLKELAGLIVEYCTYDEDERQRNLDMSKVPEGYRLFVKRNWDMMPDRWSMDLAVRFRGQWMTGTDWVWRDGRPLRTKPEYIVPLLCPLCGIAFRSEHPPWWCLNHRRFDDWRLNLLDFDPGLGTYD
jgi:hypothetical protein